MAAIVWKTAAVGCLLIAGSGLAQAPAADAQFEVASIKLNRGCGPAGDGGKARGLGPGRLDLPCMRMRGLIGVAYAGITLGSGLRAKPVSVVGGAAWVDAERYDFSAIAGRDISAADMTGSMMQEFLRSRCGLVVHKESRDAATYALTVAKGGSKLKTTEAGSCVPMDLTNARNTTPVEGQPRICGTGRATSSEGLLKWDWYGVRMDEFAGRVLAGLTDRPIVDQTGLVGQYDIHLEFVRSQPAAPGLARLNGAEVADQPVVADDGAGPSLFLALQKQLGLTLVPAKSPVEVVVIDRIERPSAN